MIRKIKYDVTFIGVKKRKIILITMLAEDFRPSIKSKVSIGYDIAPLTFFLRTMVAPKRALSKESSQTFIRFAFLFIRFCAR